MTTLPRTEAEIEIVAEVREGEYGGKLTAVEPGGAEFIPLSERHGNPLQLLWTWTSPNLEFATVFVGVLGVAAFGLSFWQATAALVLGTALGLGDARRAVVAGAEVRRPANDLVAYSVRLPRQLAAGRAELGHGGHRLVRGQQRQRRVRAEHVDAHAEVAVAADHRGRAADDRVLRPQPGARRREVGAADSRSGVPARRDLHLQQGQRERAARPLRVVRTWRNRRLHADARRRVRLRRRLESLRLATTPAT